MKTYGRKEVSEAVVIAALSTMVCGAVQLGLDRIRDRMWRRAKEDRKRRKAAGR